MLSKAKSCFYCGESFADREKTLDHKNPKALGGKHNGNLVVACFECNNRKSDMTFEEFKRTV